MDNVKLVRLRQKHVLDLAKHANNESVSKYLNPNFPYPYTKEDAQFFIDLVQKEEKEMPSTDKTTYGIEVDGEVVGVCGFFRNKDSQIHTATFGYWLSQEHWGKGIVTKVSIDVIKEVFSQTDIKIIFADLYSENIGSEKVLLKIGFRFLYKMKDGFLKKDKLYDSKYYALTKENFLSKKY